MNSIFSILPLARYIMATPSPVAMEGFVVVAFELPFHLLRDLGSIIMKISTSYSTSLSTQLSSQPVSTNNTSNTHNTTALNIALLDTFYSSPSAMPYKKLLKAAVTELSHLPLPILRNLHPGSALFNSVSTSSTQSSSLCRQRDVFLFSTTDEKFDFLSYSPGALTRVI